MWQPLNTSNLTLSSPRSHSFSSKNMRLSKIQRPVCVSMPNFRLRPKPREAISPTSWLSVRDPIMLTKKTLFLSCKICVRIINPMSVTKRTYILSILSYLREVDDPKHQTQLLKHSKYQSIQHCLYVSQSKQTKPLKKYSYSNKKIRYKMKDREM